MTAGGCGGAARRLTHLYANPYVTVGVAEHLKSRLRRPCLAFDYAQWLKARKAGEHYNASIRVVYEIRVL